MRAKIVLCRFVFLVVAGLWCGMGFCVSPSTTETVLLKTMAFAVQDVLNRMDDNVANAAKNVPADGLNSTASLSVLSDLYRKQKGVVDCCTINAKGTIVLAQPDEYRKIEGADISTHEHIVQLHAYKKPVMSSVFMSVEGFPAVDIQHPIMNSTGQLTGSLSLLFKPAEYIAPIVDLALGATGYTCWIMQKDGYILYDTDPKQVGLDLFMAPMYKPYGDLLRLGKRIVKESSGEGEYRFLRLGTKVPINKQCWWTTISLHGQEWRVVVVKPFI
ncbi:MAG: cache domain-containing protein [bacterium]|nr:cache domain-containing protein [Candidatus Sumerlaeota bacterium]